MMRILCVPDLFLSEAKQPWNNHLHLPHYLLTSYRWLTRFRPMPVQAFMLLRKKHRISIREELSRRGSDWQYIFDMEHLPLHPTKPSLIEGRYPTVGHFEGKMFSSWACEPGCYSTKPVLKWITCPIANYLSSKMPNCQYSREVVGISFYQLEVEFYV